jgi:pyridoxamine 5'-phosphate oxidase
MLLCAREKVCAGSRAHHCPWTLGRGQARETGGAVVGGRGDGASRAPSAPQCQHGDVPDLSQMRRDYDADRLREEDLAPTWVEQFDRWFAAAVAVELPEPNAVVVATADADGAPDARIVLMKGYDEAGFVFGSSYASAKGAQLAVNPRAALVFPWHPMQRQVRVAGRVERIGETASDALWDPRPRGAQLAAVASVQSTVVASREELAERVRVLDEQTGEGPVPRPAAWGGYRVVPERVEFWQGGADRLHDRIRFVRDDAEGGGWIVQRLAP